MIDWFNWSIIDQKYWSLVKFGWLTEDITHTYLGSDRIGGQILLVDIRLNSEELPEL